MPLWGNRLARKSKEHKETMKACDQLIKTHDDDIKEELQRRREECDNKNNIACKQYIELKRKIRAKEEKSRECTRFDLAQYDISKKIEQQKKIIKEYYSRPCGDWMPCFGLFTPYKTIARKNIKELERERKQYTDKYYECIREKLNMEKQLLKKCCEI